MEAVLSNLVNLYVSTAGRRLFTLRQVLSRAQQENWPELSAALEQAIAHDTETLDLQRRWDGRSGIPRDTVNPLELDNRVDQVLSSLHLVVQSFAVGANPTSSAAQAALTLRDEVFPTGISDTVHLTHPEQVEVVDRIIAKLRGSHSGPASVIGLFELVEELAAANDKLRAAMTDKKNPVTISYDQVRAAQSQGQEHLLGITVMILGRYHRHIPEDLSRRSWLLGPILEQNEAIASYRRRRKTAPEVNPETGEPEPTVIPSPHVL